MKFNVNIENFGKIQNASITLSNFTVITGKNGCGKSFVTKAFYSFFNTINKDHLTKNLFNTIETTRFGVLQILLKSNRLNNKERILISSMKLSIDECLDFINSSFNTHYLSEQFLLKQQLAEKLNNIIDNYKKFEIEIGNKKKKEYFLKELETLNKNIFNLGLLAEKPIENIAKSIEQDLRIELQDNFQVTKLSQLINYNNKNKFSFSFEKLGTISLQYNEVEKQDKIQFKLDSASIDEFRQLNNIVFLESPIFWKLRPSLNLFKRNQFINRSLRSKVSQRELLGVPKYFFDLSDLLEISYTSLPIINNFEKISTSLKNAIGGKFDISDSGDIFYKENIYKNSPFSLHLTANGITNLGMLSLLLDKGIISDGSYLFIDEPEANLHPDWQIIMLECLLELSKSNVHVVIATHSIDMIKCIELLIKRNTNEVSEDHFAINQLSSEGRSINDDEDIFYKINAIKNDLGKAYVDMFLEENG